jgi:hypothetical protein
MKQRDYFYCGTIAITIGFELPGYTYTEQQYDEYIDEIFVSPTGRPENGPIYIVKHGNITTEQVFLLEIQFTDSVPSGITGIHPATAEQDYRFSSYGTTFIHEQFHPSARRIPVRFEIFADTLPEGTEGFQVTLFSIASRAISDTRVEIFSTPEILINNVSVIIEDDDCEFQTYKPYVHHALYSLLITILVLMIGFANTSYTVSETVGMLQVDVQVFNLPDEQRLPATVDLVIQTVSGSAGKLKGTYKQYNKYYLKWHIYNILFYRGRK